MTAHAYRGIEFAGRPCLDCGLHPDNPIHRGMSRQAEVAAHAEADPAYGQMLMEDARLAARQEAECLHEWWWGVSIVERPDGSRSAGRRWCSRCNVTEDIAEVSAADPQAENRDLLRRLDEWNPWDDDAGPLIRWAAAHLRGCIALSEARDDR